MNRNRAAWMPDHFDGRNGCAICGGPGLMMKLANDGGRMMLCAEHLLEMDMLYLDDPVLAELTAAEHTAQIARHALAGGAEPTANFTADLCYALSRTDVLRTTHFRQVATWAAGRRAEIDAARAAAAEDEGPLVGEPQPT